MNRATTFLATLTVAVGLSLAPTVAQSPDPAPVTFGDGTYTVHADIQAGRYRADGGVGCHFERLSGFGGTPLEVIVDATGYAPAVVRVEPTDVGFRTGGCGTWSALTPAEVSYGDFLAAIYPSLGRLHQAAYDGSLAQLGQPVGVLRAVARGVSGMGDALLERLDSLVPQDEILEAGGAGHLPAAREATSITDALQTALLSVPAQECYADVYVAIWVVLTDLRHVASLIRSSDDDGLDVVYGTLFPGDLHGGEVTIRSSTCAA